MECINHTVSPLGSSPSTLQQEVLDFQAPSGPRTKSDSAVCLPALGFGEVVYFNTKREMTRKDRERLPNGTRIGLYLAQINGGVVEV